MYIYIHSDHDKSVKSALLFTCYKDLLQTCLQSC